MSLRTIMIFPKFQNMVIIDNIRKQYDPLANLVCPHITMVFPFEDSMSNEELAEILNKRLHTVKPFQLTLAGISKKKDEFGNYLFLNVVQGEEEINFIHQTLYANEFKEFDKGLPYVPHMTIGKLPTVQLLNEAYESVKGINDTFSTIISKISVEMIGNKEESIIILEKELM